MDLPFYGHPQRADEDETPSPASLSFSRRNNRGPSPDKSQRSDDSPEEGMNPESSAAAAKRDTWSTRTNSMKNVGWVDVVDVRELVLFSDARRC